MSRPHSVLTISRGPSASTILRIEHTPYDSTHQKEREPTHNTRLEETTSTRATSTKTSQEQKRTAKEPPTDQGKTERNSEHSEKPTTNQDKQGATTEPEATQRENENQTENKNGTENTPKKKQKQTNKHIEEKSIYNSIAIKGNTEQIPNGKFALDGYAVKKSNFSWGCFLCCSVSVPSLLGFSLVSLCFLLLPLLFFCSLLSVLGLWFGVRFFSLFAVSVSFVFLVLGLGSVGRSLFGGAFPFLPLLRFVLRLLSLGCFLPLFLVVRVLCFVSGFSFP